MEHVLHTRNGTAEAVGHVTTDGSQSRHGCNTRTRQSGHETDGARKDTHHARVTETGGLGTTIFVTLGGAMVLAAGVVLFAKKRMSQIAE